MQVVTEIMAAIILLTFGAYFTPKIVNEFKKETIQKVDLGLPSLQRFTKKLTKK